MMAWQERNIEVLKRMSEDLTLRNLCESTVELYTYHVRRFGEFIGHSLDEATVEQIRDVRRSPSPLVSRRILTHVFLEFSI